MDLPLHLIKDELKIFEGHFKEAVARPALDRIAGLSKRKGKQIRPMFPAAQRQALRTGGMRPLYRAASLVEVPHTATPVHDDVVDNLMERRGFFFDLCLWKAKANVLIGDYLLAKRAPASLY